MAKSTDLRWEWRADRTLDQRVALDVTAIKKERRGLFGLKSSPSLGGSIPDPHVVTGQARIVLGPGAAVEGAPLSFRIPGAEAKDVAAGALLLVGVIDDAAVCVVAAPGDLSGTDLDNWLEDTPCP